MAQAPSVTRDPFVERQMKTTRSATVAFGVAIAAVRFQAGAFGQQPAVDQKMIAAIKAEALRPSEATKLFHTLTDTFGPRLTGSPAHVQAARWAVERFREWGLNDPHLEPFEFGSGWSLEKITAEMVAPRYMPLIGYAEAWSTSTSGVISGTPIYVGDSTTADIDKLGAHLRGAIVLTSRPQTEFLGADRMQPTESNGPVQTGNPPVPGRSSTAPIDQILTRSAHLAPVSCSARDRPNMAPYAFRATAIRAATPYRLSCSRPSSTTCSSGWCRPERRFTSESRSARASMTTIATATTYLPTFPGPIQRYETR
jgi:hypothetical protein